MRRLTFTMTTTALRTSVCIWWSKQYYETVSTTNCHRPRRRHKRPMAIQGANRVHYNDCVGVSFVHGVEQQGSRTYARQHFARVAFARRQKPAGHIPVITEYPSTKCPSMTKARQFLARWILCPLLICPFLFSVGGKFLYAHPHFHELTHYVSISVK